MQATLFLILLIILSVLLVIGHIIWVGIWASLFTAIVLSIIITLAVLYGKKRKQEQYDYDAENPNALIQGVNVAGTVYAKYPQVSGGLGWIL